MQVDFSVMNGRQQTKSSGDSLLALYLKIVSLLSLRTQILAVPVPVNMINDN
jgi:hypothetical protein